MHKPVPVLVLCILLMLSYIVFEVLEQCLPEQVIFGQYSHIFMIGLGATILMYTVYSKHIGKDVPYLDVAEGCMYCAGGATLLALHHRTPKLAPQKVKHSIQQT